MDRIAELYSPDRLLVSASGCWVVDAGGRKMLDFRAGISNVSLGYSRSDIVSAMSRQAIEMPFACSLRFGRQAPVTHEYASALVERTPAGLEHVRFTHTGSTAVETAILLARAAHHNLGEADRRVVISFEGSYHGISALGMAASGQGILRELYGPFPDGFVTLPQPATDDCAECAPGVGVGLCADRLRDAIEELDGGRVAAVIVEPVYGNSVHALPRHFLAEARRLCSEAGAFLIFDEVVTGFGRAGAMFEAARVGVIPDLLCVAKAMTAGYAPLGGVFAGDRVYEAFLRPGMPHFAPGSSTDGHPISCAAGLRVLEILEEEEVIPRWAAMHATLVNLIRGLAEQLPNAAAVRAAGGMVAIDVVGPDGTAADIQLMRWIERECDERGVLVQYSGSSMILVPPLVVDAAECQFAAGVVASVLADVPRKIAG